MAQSLSMNKRTFLFLMVSSILFQNCKTDDTTDPSEECPRNVDIGLEAITANSATIKWLETQGFSSNYEYGEKGFALGTGVKGNTADENVLLEDLKPDTEYDFYLQSVCTPEVTGEFITNPYTFTTLTCYDLSADKIGFIGYVENGDFSAFWIPNRKADEWQVAMLKDGANTPSEAQIYIVDNKVTNRFDFPDIEPNVDYTFFIRGKCSDTYGGWITKGVDTGDENLFSPCIARPQNVTNDSYGTSFSVLTSGSIVVEILEENMEKGTGLQFEPMTNHFTLNKQDFHNEYAEYIKAETNYDVFVRIKCGPSFSEYSKVSSFKTPTNNAAVLESNIFNDNLQLVWYRGDDSNARYCFPYSDVTFEIEYGPQGFTDGQGALIKTDGVPQASNYTYNLPLSELDSGITYEFSIRSIVNTSSIGEWNSSHCNYLNQGRLVVNIP